MPRGAEVEELGRLGKWRRFTFCSTEMTCNSERASGGKLSTGKGVRAKQ